MDIKQLQETLAAATPAPWDKEYDDYGDEIWFGGAGCGLWTVGPCVLGGDGHNPERKAVMDANAALIAMAPDLAAEVIRLTAELDAFKAGQTYRYIGKDGKSVLARDLEEQRDAAVQANAALMVRVEEARAEADVLMAEAVEFCRRVDAGEIRSKRTYAAFAAIIEKRLAGGAA
jgi:hypothetical protein